jgi:uncharacterized membrane protein YhaH (DUF805 family)
LDERDEYGPIRVFSVSGRIGRLRYTGYTVGLTFLFYLVLGVLSALLGTMLDKHTISNFITLIPLLGFLCMLVVNLTLTIQRCHDFNASGWLSLILLIPFAPIAFGSSRVPRARTIMARRRLRIGVRSSLLSC